MATIAQLAVNVLANTGQFAAAMDSAIQQVESLGETVGRVSKRVAEFTGNVANMATGLPVTQSFSAAMQAVAMAMQAVVRVGVALASMAFLMAYFRGITFQAALASLAVNKLALSLGVLLAKVAIFSGVPLLIAMVATVESLDRSLAAVIGTLTPMQQAMEAVKEAWEAWSILIASGFLDGIMTIIRVIANVLTEIANIIQYANDVTGGMTLELAALIAKLATVYVIARSIYFVYMLVHNLWIAKAAYTAIASLAGILKSVLVTTIGLGASTAFWVSLTVVGLAAVAVAAAAAYGYYSSMSSNIDGVTAGITAMNEGYKGTIESLKEMNQLAQKMNTDALTPLEKYEAGMKRINDAANARAILEQKIAVFKAQQQKAEAEVQKAVAERRIDDAKALTVYINDRKSVIKDLEGERRNFKPVTQEGRKIAEAREKEQYFSSLGIDIKGTQSALEIYEQQLRVIASENVRGRLVGQAYTNALANAKAAFDKANPATIERAKAEEEYAKWLTSQRQSYIEMIKTPREKFVEELAKLQEFQQNAGLDQKLNQVQELRVQEKLLRDLLGNQQPKNVTVGESRAVQSGTMEAYERLQDTIRNNSNQQIARETRDLTAQEVEILGTQLDNIVKMREKLEGLVIEEEDI